MPEIIDPVFAKTSQNVRFLFSENERFGLVFVKTGSINSGTDSRPKKYGPGWQAKEQKGSKISSRRHADKRRRKKVVATATGGRTERQSRHAKGWKAECSC